MLDIEKWHSAVTVARVLAAWRNPARRPSGMCVWCGADSNCQRDGGDYRCEACGTYEVYGVEVLQGEMLLQLQLVRA